MNYRLIAKLTGDALCAEGLAMTLPLTAAVICPDAGRAAFSLSALACFGVGALLRFTPQKRGERLHTRDGFAAVALCWIVLSAFGAAPFVLSGAIADPSAAFFESVSGFTTTGATVLDDVESAPRSVLLWRSLSQWIGGVGIMALTLALFSHMGSGSGHLLEAESTGPVTSKLAPHLSSSARMICAVYLLLSGCCFCLLLLAGLGPFDAAVVSMSTTATGGFSCRSDSIGAYDSTGVGAIVAVFMLLSALSYPTLLCVLRRKFDVIRRDQELRLFLAAVAVSAILIAVDLRVQGEMGFYPDIFRSIFQTVAAATTTAFFVTDTSTWPMFTRAVLIALIIFGGCSASSCGGIKPVRVLIMGSFLRRETGRVLHPHVVYTVRVDGKRVGENVIWSTCVFFFVYFLLMFVAATAITADGSDIPSALTAAMGCVGNDGAIMGITGETRSYSSFSPLSKLILCFCMFMGRLEIWPLTVLFFPSVWKAK